MYYLHLSIITMILTKKSKIGDEIEVKTFFFLKITINLGEKSKRRNQSPFFWKTPNLEILDSGP